MKRLLIGGLAVGSLLLGTAGVANAASGPAAQARPAPVSLAVTAAPTGTAKAVGSTWPNFPLPAGGLVAGQLDVNFAQPAVGDHITAYAVDCAPPVTTQSQGSNTVHVLLSPALPHMVATFAVNPDGTSGDTDYSVVSGQVHLRVGPYSLTQADKSPPFVCTVTAINAGGASLLNKPSTATGVGLFVNCASAENSPSGLANELDPTAPGFDINTATALFTGSNNSAPTVGFNPALPLARQVNNNYDAVVATTPLGTSPFCTTGATYSPHLLSDQPVTFGPTLAVVPARVATSRVTAHNAGIKVTGLGLTASVKSGLTLTVSAGSEVLYAYDAFNYGGNGQANTGPAAPECTSTATQQCVTNTQQIVALAATQSTTLPRCAAAAPGCDFANNGPGTIGYIATLDSASHIIKPGSPIVSTPVSILFSKNPALGGTNPTGSAGVGLVMVASQTQLGIGTGLPVPVSVTAPGNFLAGYYAQLVAGGFPAAGIPAITDTNMSSPAAFAPFGLF